MSANIESATDTSKQLTEKQKSLLNLSTEFQRNIAVLVGTTNVQVTVSIEVPEAKFEDWMVRNLEEGNVLVLMRDDSLPF